MLYQTFSLVVHVLISKTFLKSDDRINNQVCQQLGTLGVVHKLYSREKTENLRNMPGILLQIGAWDDADTR